MVCKDDEDCICKTKTMIPKFWRRIIYKRILKIAKQKEIFLCWAVRNRFPYLGISHYPELWDRREHASVTCLVPFNDHKERVEYLQQALELLSNSQTLSYEQNI